LHGFRELNFAVFGDADCQVDDGVHAEQSRRQRFRLQQVAVC
jgi:hypothetical protein